MKTLVTIYILFLCSALSAQDTMYYVSDWQTIGFYPRVDNDTAQWQYGKLILTSDSTFIQFRKDVNGVTQRREFLYKKD